MSTASNFPRAERALPPTPEAWVEVRIGAEGPFIVAVDATFPDPDGARVLGYTPAELVGKSGMVLVHPNDLGRASAIIADWSTTGRRTVSFTLDLVAKGGERRAGEISVRRTGEGAALLHLLDVTDRDRTFLDLNRRGQELLSSLVALQSRPPDEHDEVAFDELVAALLTHSAIQRVPATWGPIDEPTLPAEVDMSAVAPALFAALLRAQRERRRQVATERAVQLLTALTRSDSSNLEEVYRATLRACVEHSGWPYAQLWSRRCDGTFELTAWHASEPRFELVHEAVEALPDDLHVTTMVPAGATAEAAGLEERFLVPVISAGKTVMVLDFFAREPGFEDACFLRLMEAVAVQLGDLLEQRKVAAAFTSLDVAVRRMSDGLIITGFDGGSGKPRVEFVNAAFCRLTGYDPEHLELIPPEPFVGSFGGCMSCTHFSTGCPTAGDDHEAFIRRADGEMVEMGLFVSPVLAGARTTHVVCVVRDTAERKREVAARVQLESAVAQASTEWRQTFDAVELPLITVDEKCRIVRLNRAARDLVGLSYGRLVGRPFQAIASKEPWLTGCRLLVRTIEHRLPTELQAHGGTGEPVWDLAATPTDTAGAKAILTIRDVTHTVRLQESLRKTETMAALGAIMAGVAHEVRNPLFGISATLDAFEAAFGAQKASARYLEVLRSELARLATLMRDLLEYGRPPVLSTGKHDLVAIVDEAIERSAFSVKNGISVHHVRPSEPRHAVVDKDRLVQVLINLIDNAIHHSPRNGLVTIRHELEIDAAAERWALLQVDDQGPGIPPEDAGRIFEPFFTKRVGGTGLGLSIVQRIIEQHGGKIEPGLAPGGGAQLMVKLKLEATDGG